MANLTTEQVWEEIDSNLFAVVGMVSARQQARTAGIVYVVRDRKLYFATGKEEWKTKHIMGNPQVSVTVAIPKRVPFMPWIKVPAATITFAGVATVQDQTDADPEVLKALHQGVEQSDEEVAFACVIGIAPVGDFVTYGVGVSLMTMRDTEKARGRAAVG